MKVVLEDAVFRSPGSNLMLLDFFHLAFEGIHRVEVDTEARHFEGWLKKRGRDDQEECRSALDWSLEAETREPSRFVIHVDDIASSDWRAEVPRVTVIDGLRVLREPFCVLLEDGESDRGFLLSMATAEQRAFLLAMAQAGGLVFDHGGGLPNMTRRLKSDRETKPHARLRTWVLFDSDALRPNMPSEQSQKLKKACKNHFAHHQLERRAIENYLPRRALSLRAHRGPRVKANLAPKVDALFRMRLEQRSHYNMKKGFEGDRKRNPDAGDLYDDLTAADRASLQDGFGDRIAELFADGSVTEPVLKADGGWDEVNRAVTKLIALIR